MKIRFFSALPLILALYPTASIGSVFDVQYYLVDGTYNGPGSGDPDFNTVGCCTKFFYDEAKSELGAHGLPVYNSLSSAPVIHDVNSDGEITWWSPEMNPHVKAFSSGTITTPFSNVNFFPGSIKPGYANDDAHGFLGARISGMFNLSAPQEVQFKFGADDDAFLAIDNQIVSQLGGIHGVSPAPVSTSTLSAGQHTVNLFWVDRNVTGSGLYFDVTSKNVTIDRPISAVPEPQSWALLIGGVALTGGAIRWHQHSKVRRKARDI